MSEKTILFEDASDTVFMEADFAEGLCVEGAVRGDDLGAYILVPGLDILSFYLKLGVALRERGLLGEAQQLPERNTPAERREARRAEAAFAFALEVVRQQSCGGYPDGVSIAAEARKFADTLCPDEVAP